MPYAIRCSEQNSVIRLRCVCWVVEATAESCWLLARLCCLNASVNYNSLNLTLNWLKIFHFYLNVIN